MLAYFDFWAKPVEVRLKIMSDCHTSDISHAADFSARPELDAHVAVAGIASGVRSGSGSGDRE